MTTPRRVNRYYTSNEITRRGTRYGQDVDTESDEMPFVKFGGAIVPNQQDSIARIGTALVGGDFTGGPRGTQALDIQGARSETDQVASGAYAIAIGNYNLAAGQQSVAIGHSCTAPHDYAVAMGMGAITGDDGAVALGSGASATSADSLAVGTAAKAFALDAIALGHQCEANALGSMAIGFDASTRVPLSINIAATSIVRRSDGRPIEPEQWFAYYAAAEAVVFSDAVDLTIAGDIEFGVPGGGAFFVNEVGLVLVKVAELASQPVVRYGWTGNLAGQLAATRTTELTAVGQRERYLPLAPEVGQTTLSFGVTAGASAGMFKARAYWKGLFVEDEAA